MSIEIDDDSDLNEVVVELHGTFSKADLHQFVDQLDTEAEIQRFRIDIVTGHPSTLSLPERTHPAAEGDGGEARSDTGENPSDGSTVSRTDESADEQTVSESAEPSTPEMPRLQTGGNPYHIMRVIAERDDWIRTKEIREAIHDDWDVSKDTIGTNLWNLADRDLVEKRPYEMDNRQTEYQITKFGEQALSRAVDRADDTQPVDVEA